MPLSTRPSSSQSSIHQHPQTACPLTPGRHAWKAESTSTPNCMPPSTRPSISQITFHSLLEVRTPIAFSYLGKKVPSQKRHTPNAPKIVFLLLASFEQPHKQRGYPPTRIGRTAFPSSASQPSFRRVAPRTKLATAALPNCRPHWR